MRPRRTAKPSVDSGLLADDGFALTDELLATFSGQSTIGFAIFDRQLRFQALNNVLATTNGIAAEAHLGRTVREILGDVAEKIEPAFERVLVTRKPVLKQCAGKLSARPEVVHWIASYFPVKDSAGKVQRVGAVVVELTDQKKLQNSFAVLSRRLLQTRAKEQRRMADELNASITQYYATLKKNLSYLVRSLWQWEDRGTLLEQAIELVEHFPIISINNFATAAAIFREIEGLPKLRTDLFSKIAGQPELQQEILEVLAKHPEIQQKLLSELANTLQFRRRLMKLAGGQAVKMSM
jgi:hypothetical protein